MPSLPPPRSPKRSAKLARQLSSDLNSVCLFLRSQCPIEWFHYGCVGIEEAPKGKWYCEECNPKRHKTHI